MGNSCCVSSSRQQHIRVTEEGLDRSNKRRLKQKTGESAFDGFGFDVHDEKQKGGPTRKLKISVDTELEDSDSSTVPLSMSDSTMSISSPVPSTKKKKMQQKDRRQSFKGVDSSSGAEKPSLVDNISNKQTTPSTTTSSLWTSKSDSVAKPGRALQKRLQKAHYMQMVMSLPLDGTSGPAFFGPSQTPYAQKARSRSLSFLSPSPDNKLNNEEFESSLQKGIVWADIDTGSAVLTMVFSQQEATLECTAPPLFLAIGTAKGQIRVTELLNYDNGPRLGVTTTAQRQGRIRTLDFLPGEGNCLACGGDDGVCALLRFHKNGSTQVLAEIPRSDRIYSVKFSPDAQFLAIGGYDETVALIDVTSLTAPCIVAEIGCLGLISALAWSPDGEFLAMGGSDKVCSVIAQKNGWRGVQEVRRHAPISSLQWHPQINDIYRLAIGANDIVLIDANFNQSGDLTFAQEDSCVTSSPFPGGNVHINGLCWSPNDGNYIVVCGSDSRAKLLETKTLSTIQEVRHSAKLNCSAWGQQSILSKHQEHLQQFLALGGDDGKVLILKAGPSELQAITDDNTSLVTGSHLSHDVDWAQREDHFLDVDDQFTSRLETQIEHHAVSCDEAISDIDDDDDFKDAPVQERQVHGNSLTFRAMAFSQGSSSQSSAFFAAASADGFVTVRSMPGFKIQCQLEFLDPITCVAFSNGSRLIACGSNDAKVRIVATAPAWSMLTVIDAKKPVVGLLFSKNNERLAIIGNDGALAFVNPQNQFASAGRLEHKSMITAIDWSPTHMATGQEDGTVFLYNSDEIFDNKNLSSKSTIAGSSPVRSLAFGPHGRFVAVGGDDGILSVFSQAGGWALVHRLALGFGIANLKWSPTGRHLAVTGNTKESQLQVFDTAFWANVDEVRKAASTCRCPSNSDFGEDELSAESISLSRRKNYNSLLAISQDGKLLAFIDSKYGFRIVSTLSWDVVFDVQQQGQAIRSTAATSSTFVDWEASYHLSRATTPEIASKLEESS
ncbi:hypothetical protein ACA910_002423 [Epithemia clementina (nom. ined.)]